MFWQLSAGRSTRIAWPSAKRSRPLGTAARPEEFDAWWAQGYAALRVLDSELAIHDYLVGDRFSIADVALYAYVHCAGEGGFDLDRFGALARWFAPIEARPAYLPLSVVPS